MSVQHGSVHILTFSDKGGEFHKTPFIGMNKEQKKTNKTFN